MSTRFITFCALLIGLAGLNPAQAQQESPLSAIREGHWLEIRGEFKGDGKFEAARVDLIHSQRYEVLIGTIAEKEEDDKFIMLDESVEVVEKTTFKRVERGHMVGQRVKIEGYYLGGKRFSARKISPRGKGRDRLAGRVDRIRPDGNGWLVNIMNFTVSIPQGILLRHKDPLDKYPLSETRMQPVSASSRNEDDLFGEGIRISENLLAAGLIEAKWTEKDNVNLDDQVARDRQDTETSVRARLVYRPSSSFIGVMEVRYVGLWRNDERLGRFFVDDTRLGETFMYFRNPLKWNVDFQAGRIDFDEKREWLYDQNLDGLRIFHFGRNLVTELSVSTTLSSGSPRDKSATNTMLYVSNGNQRKHLAAYIVHRDFDLWLPEKRTHVGVRAFGKWLPGSKSWLEISYMTGKVGSFDAAGWGFDVGNTYKLDNGLNFTLGYAFGQGDNPMSVKDNSFRQTGLQDNNAKFAGVTSFKYYGELANPELVNLKVLTAGMAYRFPQPISIDLVGHYYRQDKLNRRWINTGIRKRPNGISRDLGWELDFILGWRTQASWDLEIVAAYFDPGGAFDNADSAFLGKIQFRYRF